MSETWKKWEGQVVDHKYQLLKHVGSTDHSVVFLAEFHDPEPRQVAVKFISADFAGREQQLAAWSTRGAAKPSQSASNLWRWRLQDRGYGADVCGDGVRRGESGASSAAPRADGGRNQRDAEFRGGCAGVPARERSGARTHQAFERAGDGRAVESFQRHDLSSRGSTGNAAGAQRV